jgi:hypothetical protein
MKIPFSLQIHNDLKKVYAKTIHFKIVFAKRFSKYHFPFHFMALLKAAGP